MGGVVRLSVEPHTQHSKSMTQSVCFCFLHLQVYACPTSVIRLLHSPTAWGIQEASSFVVVLFAIL